MNEASALQTDAAATRAARASAADIARRHWRTALAVAGIIIVVAGQALTSRDYDDKLGWLSIASDRVRAIYGARPESVAMAGILLILGAVLFAVGAWRSPQEDPVLSRETPGRDVVDRRLRWGSVALFGVGALFALYLNLRLFNGHYEPYYVWVFYAAIIAVGAAFLLGRWSPSLSMPFRIHPWEIAVVAAALVFFLVVNVRDLDSWRYAAIGDEFPFYGYALGIANGTIRANIFSQLGVWDQRPVGTTAIQALTMSWFGQDSFGWRVATPIALALAIPAVWLCARELFDRTVAAFATLIFATSHYLFAYAHTTYDNVFAIVPFAWCLALAVMGLRRRNTTLLYASGVVGGLGFYTFPTARMAPIVLILFLVTLGPRAWKPGILAPIAIGLLVAGLPLFATDRWDAISVSQDRTVFGFQDSPSEGVLTRLYENVPRSLFGFNYNPNAGHFVSGSLLDPVAAVLLVLGLAYGLSRIRSEPYRLLAIWLIITVVFAGILSPYNRVAYDRLHLVLPVAAIYGGIAVAALLRLIQPALPRRDITVPALAAGTFILLAPLLAYLNLERFLVDGPDAVPTTEERIAIRGLTTDQCSREPTAFVIVRTPQPLLIAALQSYAFRDEITTMPTDEAATSTSYEDFNCVVVTRLKHPNPDEVSGKVTLTCQQSCWREANTVIQRLKEEGFTEATSVTSGTAHFEAVVLTRG